MCSVDDERTSNQGMRDMCGFGFSFVRNDVGVARRVRGSVGRRVRRVGHAGALRARGFPFGARAGLSANPSPPSTAVPVPAGADFGLSRGGVVLSGEPFSVVLTLAPFSLRRTERLETRGVVV